MKVHTFECPECGDSWNAVAVASPREECRECGARVEHDVYEVAG